MNCYSIRTKPLLITLLVLALFTGAHAQATEGRYETYFYGKDFNLNKYMVGDIDILPGGRYRFGKYGEGRYTMAGEVITWVDGPLKGVYATYKTAGRKKPAIVIPRKHNQAHKEALVLISDIWGYLQ